MSRGQPPRVVRHALPARLGHGAAVVAVALLLVTGWALAQVLPEGLVGWLGGHALASGAHDLLGLAGAAVAAGVAAVLRRRVGGLLRELGGVRREDFIWLRGFLRDPLGRRAPRAWHAGRLDPLQRWVLAVMLAMLALAAASGVCLYFTPPGWRWVFVVAVRLHVAASEVLVAAVLVHVLAGSGLLPTHRGMARSMFGDGTVPLATARRLWPGWTAAQPGLPADDGAPTR